MFFPQFLNPLIEHEGRSKVYTNFISTIIPSSYFFIRTIYIHLHPLPSLFWLSILLPSSSSSLFSFSFFSPHLSALAPLTLFSLHLLLTFKALLVISYPFSGVTPICFSLGVTCCSLFSLPIMPTSCGHPHLFSLLPHSLILCSITYV